MSWRFDKVRAGSGALGDVGSHCIDLLQYLAGPISQVAARMQTFIPQRRDRDGNVVDVTVDDQTEILADFESGASGTILASWAGTGHKCDLGFEVIGSRGSVSVHVAAIERAAVLRRHRSEDRQGFRTILVGPAHPGADGIHTVAAQGLGYTDAFTIAARNTLRNLSAGKVLSGPTFVDGLRVAEVTDAVIAAVASGSTERGHSPHALARCLVGDADAAEVVEAGLGVFQRSRRRPEVAVLLDRAWTVEAVLQRLGQRTEIDHALTDRAEHTERDRVEERDAVAEHLLMDDRVDVLEVEVRRAARGARRGSARVRRRRR